MLREKEFFLICSEITAARRVDSVSAPQFPSRNHPKARVAKVYGSRLIWHDERRKSERMGGVPVNSEDEFVSNVLLRIEPLSAFQGSITP